MVHVTKEIKKQTKPGFSLKKIHICCTVQFSTHWYVPFTMSIPPVPGMMVKHGTVTSHHPPVSTLSWCLPKIVLLLTWEWVWPGSPSVVTTLTHSHTCTPSVFYVVKNSVLSILVSEEIKCFRSTVNWIQQGPTFCGTKRSSSNVDQRAKNHNFLKWCRSFSIWCLVSWK